MYEENNILNISTSYNVTKLLSIIVLISTLFISAYIITNFNVSDFIYANSNLDLSGSMLSKEACDAPRA